MRECVQECYKQRSPCDQRECRMHIEFPSDLNCTVIAVKKHGPMTLEEIGETFDLTRERVRQIKEKAIRRLKHTSRSKILKTYLG